MTTAQKAARKPARWSCGWCATGDHAHCRPQVCNGSKAARPVAYCACALAGHVRAEALSQYRTKHDPGVPGEPPPDVKENER